MIDNEPLEIHFSIPLLILGDNKSEEKEIQALTDAKFLKRSLAVQPSVRLCFRLNSLYLVTTYTTRKGFINHSTTNQTKTLHDVSSKQTTFKQLSAVG